MWKSFQIAKIKTHMIYLSTISYNWMLSYKYQYVECKFDLLLSTADIWYQKSRRIWRGMAVATVRQGVTDLSLLEWTLIQQYGGNRFYHLHLTQLRQCKHSYGKGPSFSPEIPVGPYTYCSQFCFYHQTPLSQWYF